MEIYCLYPSKMFNPIAHGRGGLLAHAIRLIAVTLKPLKLWLPNFVNLCFSFWPQYDRILANSVQWGAWCSHFSKRGHDIFFFLLKMAEIWSRHNFESEKPFLIIKSDFGIVKPDFWGKNIGTWWIVFTWKKRILWRHISKDRAANFPIITWTKFQINQVILTLFSGVWAKSPPPPPPPPSWVMSKMP